MEHEHFDRLARTLASGVSRRSVLRRAAASAMASPLALAGVNAAAQGNSNKNKDKDKDKGSQGGPGASGCRPAGHPCVGQGNQNCCDPYCWVTGPGSVPRCSPDPPPDEAAANQTVVNANNQVC